jgi:hypothetical protein
LKAHEKLKNALVTALVLEPQRRKVKFLIEADASASQLGVQLIKSKKTKRTGHLVFGAVDVQLLNGTKVLRSERP